MSLEEANIVAVDLAADVGSAQNNYEVWFNSQYIRYGADDDYPNLLNNLVKNCPLHGSLVKGIAQMIAGRGLAVVTDDESKATEFLNSYDRITSSKGQDVYEILVEHCEEIKKNGYSYLEVIKKKDKVIVNVIPARFGRNMPHGLSENPKEFMIQVIDENYVDDDYFDYSKAESFNAFDGKRNSSILFSRVSDTTTVSYAAPDYQGAIEDIILDSAARENKLNSVQNGFMPSALVNFNSGVPPLEKRKRIEKKFLEKYTGANGKARVMFSWNEIGQETQTTFDSFEPPNFVEFFKDLAPEVSQNILNGHRVTSPLLFGVRSGQGGLGSNQDEMIQAFDIFTETVLIPYQKIIGKAWSSIFSFTGYTTPIEVIPMIPKALDPMNAKSVTDAPANPSKGTPTDKTFLRKVKDKIIKILSDGERSDTD